MTKSPVLTLNDGCKIPQLGLGVWKVSDAEAAQAVSQAIQAGYRLIDTAMIYQNEKGVGQGLRDSGVKREELFLTTKVWNDDQGYDQTLKAFDTSMKKLQADYLDLYLVHWPSPKRNLYSQTWKALVRLREEGRVRSIGVSNFYEEHLQQIMDESGIVPVLNQVELHPLFQQNKLRAFHRQHNIHTQAWSPLAQASALQNPTLLSLAQKHQKSSAQIVLRWHMQESIIAIPKSIRLERMKENLHVFDFQLDSEDMRALASLDSAKGRVGPDPMTADF